MTGTRPSLDPSATCPDDTSRRLVRAAFETIADLYVVERHQIGAALMDAAGVIHRGVHLDAMVGRAATCAEAVALGVSRLAGGSSLVAMAAVRFPKPTEDGPARIVPPCGLCRELLLDYAPGMKAVIPVDGVARLVPLATLLPHKYVGTKWLPASL